MSDSKLSKSQSISSTGSSSESLHHKRNASASLDDKEVLFWIRSEIFDFGLLPLPPRSKISFASLLEVVKKYRYEHELNAKYYKAINTLYPTELNKENVMISFREWETIATENLELNETQIRFYFDRFVSLKEMHVGSSKILKDREIGDPSINFYEFIVYLFCQIYSKSSFSKSYERGVEWPSVYILNEEDGTLESLEEVKAKENVDMEAFKKKSTCPRRTSLISQYNFIKENINLILRLLSADEPQNTIKRSELKPIKSLFACGNNFHSLINTPIVDFLPRLNKKKKYGRLELGEWIIHKLRINTHIYLFDNDAKDQNIRISRGGPHKKTPLHKPIRIINVHNKTLLRTDPDSLPKEASPPKSPKHSESVDALFGRIQNCTYCYIYLLCPMFHIKIENCNNCTIVLGAVSGIVSVENCKSVTIIAACHSIQISDCDSSIFYLFTNRRPVLIGSNHGLKFGPYNTHYRSLLRHIYEAKLDMKINEWDEPIFYVMEILKQKPSPNIPYPNRAPIRATPHRVERSSYVIIKPDHFVPFRIPFELQGQTKQIPFELSNDYQLALEEHSEDAINFKKVVDKIKDKKLQSKIQELIREKFESWLVESGEIQQIEDLISLQME